MGGRGSVLVCRNQCPKKDFKVGRGGEEEFSINATERQLRQSTPNHYLAELLFAFSQTKEIVIKLLLVCLAGCFNYL